MNRNLEDAREKIRSFNEKRNWNKFHSPKNLAMALSVEVGELVEHFQWLTEDESRSVDAQKLADIKEEMADILIYLLNISDKLNIDLLDAVGEKLQINEKKYPVDKAFNSSKKYTDI